MAPEFECRKRVWSCILAVAKFMDFVTSVGTQYSFVMEEVSAMSLDFYRKLKGTRRIRNRRIDFVGWVLFIMSAIAFFIASIGSLWVMCGSAFYLLACLVFIFPFFRNGCGFDCCKKDRFCNGRTAGMRTFYRFQNVRLFSLRHASLRHFMPKRGLFEIKPNPLQFTSAASAR